MEATDRAIDRLEWKPNKKQAIFLSIPPSIKEALYGGGAGSGKSDVLMMYGICHRWHEHPRFKQVLMRRTLKILKKEIVPRSRDIYPKFGATFNASDMAWTFPRPDQYGSGFSNSGAMIFLGHCEEEKNVHDYDTMEISLFSPDEITSLTFFIYNYIVFERNRAPKGTGLPSITRAAGMPGDIGHKFTKTRFIDPYKRIGIELNDAHKTAIEGRGGNLRIYIHATQADNKDYIDPTYEQSLKGRPEAEMKAKLYGDWDAYLGQVFDEFRDKHYSDEPENALHVIQPFQIPDWWPRFIIGDWGYTAMTYIGWYAVSPNKRLYLYRELYWYKTKIADWAPIVKDFYEREAIRKIKFCQSVGQDRGQEQTIQQQIEDALGTNIELTMNSSGSRISGKMLVHEYLRWKPKPIIKPEEMPVYSEEHANWIYRNEGIIAYKTYLSIFDPPQEETNIPRLQIFCCGEDTHEGHSNCCPIMIDTIKACSYDKPKKDKPAEDVAEFEGDDPYDDLRYACDTAENYFEEAGHEFDKIKKQADIIARLNATGDMTAFYRNMRTVEAANRPKMVRMFHRR